MAVHPSNLRADAGRNRSLIIEAARRLYATEGLAMSMTAVARDAGVGKATLFRHFATPQQLVDAVFADRMEGYVQAATDALGDPDPWRGFVGYITTVCEMQARDRGFAEVLTLTFPLAEQLEARRLEAYRGFVRIIARAKKCGHLRTDFRSEDLIVLLMANAGVIAATAGDAPETWRRLVGHMLRAFANPGAPELPCRPRPHRGNCSMPWQEHHGRRTDRAAHCATSPSAA